MGFYEVIWATLKYTDTTWMSSSSSTAFGLVTWDPYSGRPGNTHAALHGYKQDTAMQNTTLLSLSVPITSILSFWVAMCGLWTEELFAPFLQGERKGGKSRRPQAAATLCLLIESLGRNLCPILALQAIRKGISTPQLEVWPQPGQMQQRSGSETVRRMLSRGDCNPKMLQFIFLLH